MKVGILTFHNAANYGAVFQAYALSKYLENKGCDVYFIDYKSSDRNNVNYDKVKLIMHLVLVNPRSTFQKMFLKFSGVLSSQRESKFKFKFVNFRKKYFKLTRQYRSLEELQIDPPIMDLYISGSDQVWSSGSFGLNPAFFLKFGPTNIKKISYAASFGTPYLPENSIKLLPSLLSNFDEISVRESSGAEIIHECTDFKACHVVDPTLLLAENDYAQICSGKLAESVGSPYLLVYRLRQSLMLDVKMSMFVKKIAEERNLKVVTVSTNGVYKFLETGIDVCPSPEEFLGLIKNANFFITNSFHGVIFAIIYKTNFFCMPRFSDSKSQNIRIIELLERLSLSDLYINDINNISSQINIDWSEVYNMLCDLNKGSMIFLSKFVSNKQ